MLAEITDFSSQIVKQVAYPKVSVRWHFSQAAMELIALQVNVHSVKVAVHACADTLNAVAGFGSAFAKAVNPTDDSCVSRLSKSFRPEKLTLSQS